MRNPQLSRPSSVLLAAFYCVSIGARQDVGG
jgi:hypothetical protein